ncbi:uncharacterized protein LOC144634336 [Oculina patagonica]
MWLVSNSNSRFRCCRQHGVLPGLSGKSGKKWKVLSQLWDGLKRGNAICRVPSNKTLSSVPEIQRLFVIAGIAKTLTTIDQIITVLASFGALDYIRSHKNVMKPLLTLNGARHFKPTPELYSEGLNVLFREEGSNR